MTKTELWVEVEFGDCREVIAEFPDNPIGMDEARALATERGGVVLLAEFEFSDSSLIEDCRETEES
jgi:hypothetical protein